MTAHLVVFQVDTSNFVNELQLHQVYDNVVTAQFEVIQRLKSSSRSDEHPDQTLPKFVTVHFEVSQLDMFKDSRE